MTDHIPALNLTILFDAAIKSCFLLAVAAVVAHRIGRKSPAAGHRLWVLAFGGCLLLPLVSVVVPAWTLPILQQPWMDADWDRGSIAISPEPDSRIDRSTTSTRTEPVSRGQEPLALVDAVWASPPSRPADNPLAAEFSSDSDNTLESTAAATYAELASSSSARSWGGTILVAWIAGVVVSVVRMLRQQWLLARLLSGGRPVHDDAWALAERRASSALDLKCSAKLIEVDEACSPMVTGLRQPVLVVPVDAGHWEPERRFLVMLHELAHVKRRDVLTQTFAGCVSALYWFNPLCWRGLSEMRKLRELACDDMVLAHGQIAADYADVLLNVARSYRHQRFIMVVGMARESNIENRILAVLDRARKRAAMSRGMSRVLLFAVAALVLLIGSLQLRSAAGPVAESSASAAEEAETHTAESATGDDRLRPLLVRVVNEEGEPLEGASLHISVWYVDGYDGPKVARDYVTDQYGSALVQLPQRLRILRMWPSKAGYVPRFVNFAQGSHDEGKLIPPVYEFQLTRGTEIGGTVVDEDGQPIAGVEVDVSVDVDEPSWGVNPESMISTWLTDEDFNRGSAITDAQGRWSIDNAPAPTSSRDYEFRLRFTHEGYASDAHWGELQTVQGLTTAMLRDRSAKLVMSGGVAVTGTVVSGDGKPVTRGLVIWDDDPYHGPTVLETQIDQEGRFQTLRLPPGEYPFTVVAPGYHPERRMVTVTESLDELHFTLRFGKRLAIQFVDPEGSPIPHAHVGIREWRGEGALYNHDHPNVPDSGVPRLADETGLYVWDWAPEDAVGYYFSAKDFTTVEATLTATEAPHVVTLAPELVATGRVIDATTGEPIDEFQAVSVKQYRPDFMTTLFRNQRPGESGRYELPLADGPGSYDRYRVRIEADGYRSVVSQQSFAASDGRVVADFALEPAAPRRGRVVDQQGDPVGDVTVIQASPSIIPHIRNNRLEWDAPQFETSETGDFELRATFEPVRIRFLHALGFAEVLRQPDEELGTIQLQPWAGVSGQLTQDGVPVPEQRVYFHPVASPQLGEPRFQDSFAVQTDADGRFAFDRLPPIAGSIRAYLGPWQESPLTSSKSVPLNLTPGERRTIALGGVGATVTGRVLATGRGDVPLDRNWSLNYLIGRDGGIELPGDAPALSFDPSEPVQPSWFLDPSHQLWLASRENHFVKLAPDGTFKIHGVPPGIYDLVFRLYEQPAGCLVETVGEKIVTIEVTGADARSGTKDLGSIEVACRAGPRPGENMQAYRFTDASGRERLVRDLEGNYLGMHVWATWCAPCLESLPHMNDAIGGWAGQPVAFVGLNIDADRMRAKSLAQEHGWNWSQSYLGEASDMARQLAISSVPTYFLIGPDGTLVTSTTDWTSMREILERELRN